LERRTITCALIADVIVGVSGTALTWLIRS
jgi:hypothetical protein